MLEILLLATDTFFQIFTIFIIIHIIFTWFPSRKFLRYILPIMRITTPVFTLVRRVIPPFGNIDFSPIVVIFGANILHSLIRSLILSVLT